MQAILTVLLDTVVKNRKGVLAFKDFANEAADNPKILEKLPWYPRTVKYVSPTTMEVDDLLTVIKVALDYYRFSEMDAVVSNLSEGRMADNLFLAFGPTLAPGRKLDAIHAFKKAMAEAQGISTCTDAWCMCVVLCIAMRLCMSYVIFEDKICNTYI